MLIQYDPHVLSLFEEKAKGEKGSPSTGSGADSSVNPP
jgi:hypothetical protein